MAITTHKEAVKEASELLSGTVQGLSEMLQHPELQGLKRRLISQINKAKAHLQGAAGIYTPNANMQEVNEIISGFQPLESVGGEPLARVMPVNADDLDVKQEAKDRFILKRDDLFLRFPELGANHIFSLMKEPDGTILIRSVAKMAGLPDFREREIDVEFISEVQKLITGQLEVSEAMKQAEGEAAINTDQDDQEGAEEGDEDNVQTGAPSYAHLTGKGKAKPAPAPKKTGGK